MKKLVVLILFMFMASLASASLLTDLSLDLDGTTITVTGLGSSIAVNPVGFGMYVNSGGNVSGPLTSHANAGDARAVVQWTGWNGIDVTVMDLDALDGQDGVILGEWFTFQYDGSVGDTFNLYNYNATVTAAGTITVTPEPMTLALLGIGGLFLRRRRAA